MLGNLMPYAVRCLFSNHNVVRGLDFRIRLRQRSQRNQNGAIFPVEAVETLSLVAIVALVISLHLIL